MTTFETKLEEQFSNFQLKAPSMGKNKVPRHLKHIYVDYIELLALFSNGSYMTASELWDRLIDEGVINIQDSEESYSEIFSDVAEQLDEQESEIRDLFRVLKERVYLYEDDYPFVFDENGLKIKSDLSFKHELYLILLIASNLNMFSVLQPIITKEFETISKYVLKNFLPENAIIKGFGKDSDYEGTAKEKIEKLANDLNIEINKKEFKHISDENMQERGLDVIGWIPFKDKLPNLVAILGQCACGKNWYRKQNETVRFENYFNFYKLKPSHSLFIPYSLVEAGIGFYQGDEIANNLIFERKRIIEYFQSEESFNSLSSKRIVSKAVEYMEDIV